MFVEHLLGSLGQLEIGAGGTAARRQLAPQASGNRMNQGLGTGSRQIIISDETLAKTVAAAASAQD